MDDYILTILIRQRHEEILAEVKAAQLSQLRRFRVTLVNRLLRRFHPFNFKRKISMALEPPEVVERKS